jgi:hypothetical protein
MNKKEIFLAVLAVVFLTLVAVGIYLDIHNSHTANNTNTQCSPGTWSESGNQPCKQCQLCDTGEKQIAPCTKTSPTKCASGADPDTDDHHDCLTNQYKDADGCHYCTPCKENETIVKACTSTSDTKCQQNCATKCKENEICDNGTCKITNYTCNLGDCIKTADTSNTFKDYDTCSKSCKIVMTGDCKDKGPSLKPWITPPANNADTNKGVQHWLSNVIDPLAIWVPDSKTIGGIKDGGPIGGKTQDNIQAVCPYGMYFNSENTDILNSTPGNLFNEDGTPSDKSPCKDYKPNGNDSCKKYMLGQCLEENHVIKPLTKPNIYMTWFEIPTNISQNSAKAYINLVLEVCQKTQEIGAKNGNGNGITGLCFPMVTWPDQNNMTWLNTAENNTSAEKKRNALGKWICEYFLLPCEKNKVAGGLLLYTNFKDGPWASGFYKEEADGSSDLINPITNKKFVAYKCSTGSTSSTITECGEFIWGAFIHFVNNYIIPNYQKIGGTMDWLGKTLWFHVDKEGCSCGLPSQYIYWMEEFIGKGIPNFGRPKIGTRMLLATGIGTAGEGAQKPGTGTTVTEDNLYKSISVPENYWSSGNQLPCGGDSGSYFHAMSACTNLNTHRRLANYPTAYQDLIVNPGDKAKDIPSGSDCAAGWLGSGKWAAEMKTLVPNKPKVNASTDNSKGSIDIFGPNWVWPSFSIENLSLCDLDDPNCFSQYTKIFNQQKKKNKDTNPDPNHIGLSYGKENLSNKTTLCLNMLFGPDPTTQPSQGTRACGVFDGFSFWSWESMNDYLNLFCNKSGAKNVIVYEASFIPYHWLIELGVNIPKQQQFQLLPAPMISIPCKSDKDCQDPKTYLTADQRTSAQNIVCLGPDMKKVSDGKDGFCKNLCLLQPSGTGKTEQKDNTIWVDNSTPEAAQKACATYYSTPKLKITGKNDEGKQVDFTNPFNASCIGGWPGGYVEPKATTGGKTPYYNCQYHVNKLAAKKTPKSCPKDMTFTPVDSAKPCPSSIPQQNCGKAEDCDNYLKSINCGDKYYGICKSNCDCQFKPKGSGTGTQQKCKTTWKLPPNLPKDCKTLGDAALECSCDKDCENIVNKVDCNKDYTTYCKPNGYCNFHKK